MISHKSRGAKTKKFDDGAPPPMKICIPGPINFVTHSNLGVLVGLLYDAHLIGIDTETKPTFKKYEIRHRTSILQLAIRTNAGLESTVIVDLIEFGGDEKLCDLNFVLKSVMSSSTIIKIGQGLQEDFKQMYAAYPNLTALTSVNCFIEINWIYRHLDPEIKQNVSLKKLALSVLNCNLAKTEQCSDWGRRPLFEKQCEYAVRDALVLLRLFDAMTCTAAGRGDFVLSSLLGSLVGGKEVRS